MPSNSQQDIDVAIVGYGPVGQFLALSLARQGHRVAVLERWTGPYPLPRAVHFDHEVGRILQSIGIRPDSNPIIEPYDDWYKCVNDAGETIMWIDWTGLGPSWWHTANFFHQPDLEAEIHKRVAAEPLIALHLGLDVVNVAQDEYSATVTAVSHPPSADGATTRTFCAKYVVGCDGANSIVRTQIGTEMEDLGFRFDWLIVDVIPSHPMNFKPPVQQLCSPSGPTTVVPGGPGRRRWEFMRMPSETIATLNTPETAWGKLSQWGLTPDNAKLDRHTVYTFQARWARTWRSGRLLIAGDAAHLMPPFAGQGMCSGLRDAMNLQWKLDLVLNGHAGASLLDSYGTERVMHVQRWIETSVEIGRTICVIDPEEAAARDAALKAALRDPKLAPPPPEPIKLGPGITRSEDPYAGQLGIQSMTRTTRGERLFDDQFGHGWFVVSSEELAASAISTETRSWFATIDGRVLSFAHQGDFQDTGGVYERWLEALGQPVVIVRPDFYVYAACGLDDLDGVLQQLRHSLSDELDDHAMADWRAAGQ